MLQSVNSWSRNIRWIIVFIALSLPSNLIAQDTLPVEIPDSVFLTMHSPLKATFLSAVVPGLGQIYNQKYWKVPIIYGGFAGLIYYAGYNNFVYKKYKEAYNIKLTGETTTNIYANNYSLNNLLQAKDNWRRYRDLTLIGIGILYVAQIIDADVDAYLFDYDISEDLSLHIEPAVIAPQTWAFGGKNASPLGLRCTITF